MKGFNNFLQNQISGKLDMVRRITHQWRDWLLENIGGDKYELIPKNSLSVVTITAKNAMDAENQSQQIIKNAIAKEI